MDKLPVITTASGADLGKSFSGPNLRPLPFQTSKHFTVEELLVHDLPRILLSAPKGYGAWSIRGPWGNYIRDLTEVGL